MVHSAVFIRLPMYCVEAEENPKRLGPGRLRNIYVGAFRVKHERGADT